MTLIIATGVVAIIVAGAITSTSPADSKSHAEGDQWAKRECANLIVNALRETSTRDDAEAMVRADRRAQVVCAGRIMNGVRIIE